MAITPRMPDTAHRTPLRGHGARTRRVDPSDDFKRHKERAVASFSCATAEVQEHSDAARVGLRGNFVKAISNGLQASRRFYCRGHRGHSVLRAARRCAREEENETPGRRDDAVARRPQHRAGADLRIRHVSLRRVRRAGRPLLSLNCRARALSQRLCIGAIKSSCFRRAGLQRGETKADQTGSSR
jgi:hypothetical protein